MFRTSIIFVCLLLVPWLAAQEESPVVVFPPAVSSTVFTNWQMIRVAYTVGYMDGYELLLDQANPENMSFSPFELDPVMGQKLIKINERRFKEENYFDLVYYLRIVNEKKGEILIPEQMFRYVKREPGKPLDNLEVIQLKTEAVKLRYDSVLTKNADDIMEITDFGSFKRKAIWLKSISIGGLVIALPLTLFLMFRRPSVMMAAAGAKKGKSGAVEAAEEKLTPQEAVALFTSRIKTLLPPPGKFASWDFGEARGKLCNELRGLLVAYVPELLKADTHTELMCKLFSLESGRVKILLCQLEKELSKHEDILYGGTEKDGGLVQDINQILKIAGNLKPSRIVWFNLWDKIKNLVGRFIGMFKFKRSSGVKP